MKRDKPPNKSGLLIKSGSETMENEAKEQKCEFLRMLLGTLGANLLENLLAVELSGAGERTTTAAADAEIHKKKILGLGTTTLVISNKEMRDIMKINKSLNESGLLMSPFQKK